MAFNVTPTLMSGFDHSPESDWGSDAGLSLFWQVMYNIIAVVGIIGNFLVVFVVARVPSLRNLTSLFLVSLAIADLITCVFLIPLHIGKCMEPKCLFFTKATTTITTTTTTKEHYFIVLLADIAKKCQNHQNYSQRQSGKSHWNRSFQW